jgi:hypothetical protein
LSAGDVLVETMLHIITAMWKLTIIQHVGFIMQHLIDHCGGSGYAALHGVNSGFIEILVFSFATKKCLSFSSILPKMQVPILGLVCFQAKIKKYLSVGLFIHCHYAKFVSNE